jgi:hypothetical protein
MSRPFTMIHFASKVLSSTISEESNVPYYKGNSIFAFSA